MATVLKGASGLKGAGNGGGDSGKHGDTQLRKDRLIGLFALLVIAGFMLLMIWLASFGEGPPIDAFPLMP